MRIKTGIPAQAREVFPTTYVHSLLFVSHGVTQAYSRWTRDNKHENGTILDAHNDNESLVSLSAMSADPLPRVVPQTLDVYSCPIRKAVTHLPPTTSFSIFSECLIDTSTLRI